MEKEGLRRSLDLLRAHGVTFDIIVTDRHLKYKNTCGRPTSSGGFWHGRTGQPPRAAFFYDTWVRHKHLKKKKSAPLSGFLLSII